MLQFNNKYIMLCPQRTCGMCMVFDPKQCVFTKRGPACAACTKKIQTRHTKPVTLRNISTPELHCLMCGSSDKRLTAQNVYVYPHYILLCSKHHFAALQRHITKQYTSDMDVENIKKLIIDYITQWKQRAKENTSHYNRNYTDLQVKQYKQAVQRTAVVHTTR